MSLNRYAAKRDANEAEIVAVLRAMGLSVYPLPQPLDLAVGYAGRNYFVEVKSATGKLTSAQKDFTETWKGHYIIIRTVEEARDWAKKVRRNEASNTKDI